MGATPRDAAISHAELGRVLVPLRPGTGLPCRKWAHLRSTPPEAVAAWWPGDWYNPGILTGPSGYVVLDLDGPEHGTEVPAEWKRLGVTHGRDVLAVLAMRAGQEVPATHTVRSYRGGEHLYFLAGGRVIRNSASRIGPLVDVRARGGLVVGAGSVREGRRYEVTDGRDPAPLPAWLAGLADPPPAARCSPSPCCPPSHPDRYAEAALRGEVARILTAPVGQRNHALNVSAFSLGQLAASGVLACAEVVATLTGAADACGLVTDDGLRQCAATIDSGLTAGMARPRVRVVT